MQTMDLASIEPTSSLNSSIQVGSILRRGVGEPGMQVLLYCGVLWNPKLCDCFPIDKPDGIMKSLLIFCVLFIFSWRAPGAGLLLVSQEEIDFGNYPSWEARQGTFLLRNTGNSDVVLKRIRSTCGCLTSEFAGTSLPPGAEYPLKASIAANSSSGAFSKAIYVETDAPGQEFIKLSLKGNAMPLVQISPDSTVYMGKLAVGKEYRYDFKLAPGIENLQLRLGEITPASSAASAQMDIKDGLYLLSVTVKPEQKDMLVYITVNIEVTAPVKPPPLKIVLRGMTLAE